jgi:hypothetical protein
MIRDTKSEQVVARAETDLLASEKLRAGKEEYTFVMEHNKKIASSLVWFNETTDKWDEESVKAPNRINRLEHADAWALQRDVNYATSDRKRLMDIGMDSRFEKSYFPNYKRTLCDLKPAIPKPIPPK